MSDYTDLLAKIDKKNKAREIDENKIHNLRKKAQELLMQKKSDLNEIKQLSVLKDKKYINLDTNISNVSPLLSNMYQYFCKGNNNFAVNTQVRYSDTSSNYEQAKKSIKLNLIKPIDYQNGLLYLDFTKLGDQLIRKKDNTKHIRTSTFLSNFLNYLGMVLCSVAAIVTFLTIALQLPFVWYSIMLLLILSSFSSILEASIIDRNNNRTFNVTYKDLLKLSKEILSPTQYKKEKQVIMSEAPKTTKRNK